MGVAETREEFEKRFLEELLGGTHALEIKGKGMLVGKAGKVLTAHLAYEEEPNTENRRHLAEVKREFDLFAAELARFGLDLPGEIDEIDRWKRYLDEATCWEHRELFRPLRSA